MATIVDPRTSDAVQAPAGGAHQTPKKAGFNKGLAVGLGAVAVAVGGYVALASGGRKETFAYRALEQARSTAEGGNLAAATAELQKVITTYEGTEAAAEAVITLNQARLVNGQSELAAVNLREFLAGDPPAKYRAPAYGLLGSALENSKKPAEAADAYQQAFGATELEYLKAEYLVHAGRAYAMAGKQAEARKSYEQVLSTYPNSPAKTEASVRLAELTGGHLPEAPKAAGASAQR